MTTPIDRPDLYVVARILDALRLAGAPMKKTPLQQAAGINYTVFGRYLAYLAGRSLVVVRADADGTDWVELTPRGDEALRFLTAGIGRVLGVTPNGAIDSNPAVGRAPPGSQAGWIVGGAGASRPGATVSGPFSRPGP